ncbi:MAG: hypothetical protein ACI8P9_005391 [Parasphingorhabdus sp.]|jgi:hypothetical protein
MNFPSVELFTNEEHVVLADWLGTVPRAPSDNLPRADEALRKLGFVDNATESKRTEKDAAVASFLLAGIQPRLPQWTTMRPSDAGDAEYIEARTIREREISHSIELAPQFLMMINWASRPGISWPDAYYLTWVPVYDVYVVTVSADSPETFGYCDFALGHFGEARHPLVKAGEVIQDDWLWLRTHQQERWEDLWSAGPGLIDADFAQRLADDVWPDDLAEDDWEEEEALPQIRWANLI